MSCMETSIPKKHEVTELEITGKRKNGQPRNHEKSM